jgi:hypothetical protein
MYKVKKNITKKFGGDINRRKVFENILSIGYELETSSLSKLTLISQKTDLGENILLNTDSARNDIEIFQKKSENEEEEQEDENWILRQEEEVEFNAYDNNDKIDKNISFLVTNDIVESPFVKKLNKICEKIDDEMKMVLDNYVKTDVKNKLYEFHTENGQKYHFNFVFHDEETYCGVFSDVEWIFTYFKPKSSGNIIIETFANAVHNLLLHLDDLQPIRGNFVVNDCKSSFVGGDSILKSKEKTKEKTKENTKGKDCSIIVNKPEMRTLFNKPNTNLYYLQSNYYDKELKIEDVCITPQMTFSTYIYNVIPIMKQMMNDSIKLIPDIAQVSENRMNILNNIDYCVNLLLEKYNKTEYTYKITISKNKILYKSIKSYIFLIMYKLFMFYNSYLQNENIKYFKDALFFNSRHSNFVLYNSLKKTILLYFESFNPISETECISIIQKILVQKDILENNIVEKSNTKIRKNTFNINNKFDKNSSSYGNPAKSLISYLEYFEDPIETDINDWLEFKRIDAFSSKMDLNSDIVLIEFRSFTRLLSAYIYSIANENTKNKMSNGICNKMTKYYKPDIKGISISILSDFYDHFSTKKSLSRSLNHNKTISKRSKSI